MNSVGIEEFYNFTDFFTTWQVAAAAVVLVLSFAQSFVRHNTALHVAAKWGRYAVVNLLLELGADADLKNNEGISPLDIGI